MDIKDIANKLYSELNDDEINLFESILDNHNVSLELRNKVCIKLLFGHTIKDSVINLE